MTDVTGLDHVYLLMNCTDGVWWVVGVFATTDKASTHRTKYYPDEKDANIRIQRRAVQ